MSESMSVSKTQFNRPEHIAPKRVLLVGPNTKESIFDSRWVTAHQGSHWWASRLNHHGHLAATYDMNLQPGEDPDKPEQKRVELDEIMKRGMPGRITDEYTLKDSSGYPRETIQEWAPYTDILKLFTVEGRDIDDPAIVWKPWDIIGFSILDATIEYDIAKIMVARKLTPRTLLVGGGSQATLNYQTLFDKSPLDMVVLGQDPWALLRIANEEKMDLFRPKAQTGVVVRNHAYPVTTEEWTDWAFELDFVAMHQDLYWKKTASLYDNPQFQDINTFRLFLHNFCPVNCAYCTLTGLQRAATGTPTKAVGLSGNHAVEIMKRVIDKYPDTHQVFFCDDDFLLKPDWEKGFNDAVIAAKAAGELPEKLGFICLTNINRLDEESIDRCAKAGFRVLSIGVESVSQWKLNSMNKPQTPERIWKVTKQILEAGIKPYYTLLIHTPYERPEDMIVDINGFRKMGEMGVGLSIEPYLMPLHGTIFYEADVPQRYKVIPIEGSHETIKKGTAWMPVRPDSAAIFEKFEKYFPRFKKWRYAQDQAVRHKEKNYYSHTILDCQEWIFKTFFPEILESLSVRTKMVDGIEIDDSVKLDTENIQQEKCQEILDILDEMGDHDVDSVGAIIKRKATTSMTDVDFSLGRVDIRALQRKMALEASSEERISSVDSSEQLKEKKKTEEKQGSFH